MIMRPGIIIVGLLVLVMIVPGLFNFTQGQSFLHPGIDQTSADLQKLKLLLKENKQPYKDAYIRLKAEVEKPFETKAHTRVMRGPYGKPNIGGEDLRASANMAYNNALLWYISGEKKYANKAIEIINAWTPILWDFDFNDAKLIAALTGSVWCNAAEILNNTPSGWKVQDVSAFRKMLMTVYYPLLRFYFPTANGNWNGGIIQTLLAISIFLMIEPCTTMLSTIFFTRRPMAVCSNTYTQMDNAKKVLGIRGMCKWDWDFLLGQLKSLSPKELIFSRLAKTALPKDLNSLVAICWDKTHIVIAPFLQPCGIN